ncbi:MAG: cytochrome c3 family protein [Nitrospirota bacterium]|nr:cytochrome c3 family protein [Nitrospirota bacterium]
MKLSRRKVAVLAGLIVIGLVAGSFAPMPAPASPELSILFPKNRSAVGRRVNVVLDPTTDWSVVPLFQVVAGTTEFPVIDTSSGRHAFQGVDLAPGVNTITVRVLAPAPGGEASRKKGEPPRLSVVLTKSVTVFNREESFGSIPADFTQQLFHSRDQEADCSGCHRLEVENQDRNHKKPEDVLCYSCHREVPKARNVHGPAAVWNCLSCHNPDLYPVKYQFTSINPWTAVKTSQPVEPAVFTLAADDLFKPLSAVLVSGDVPLVPKPKNRADRAKYQERKNARDMEIKKRKEREQELFRGLQA